MIYDLRYIGTLGTDMNALITKFLDGVRYTAKQHELLKSYGTADVTFGTVSSWCHVICKIICVIICYFKYR